MNSEKIFVSQRERYAIIVVIALLALLSMHDLVVAGVGALFSLGIFFYTRKSVQEQRAVIDEYIDAMSQKIEHASHYALQNLPTGIAIIDSKSRICWSNSVFKDWLGVDVDKTQRLQSCMPSLRMDKIWGKSGFYTDSINDRCFRIIYKFLDRESDADTSTDSYMILYFEDISETERVKRAAEDALPVFGYIQIDNMEEVSKGLSDAERTNLWAEVNNVLVEEIANEGGFIKGYTDESYIACISKSTLNNMIANNFSVLEKVRQIHTVKRIPVTISIGIATKEPSMKAQAERARSGLDLALGRGGDQVAVYIGDEVQFYGGKSQGTEKNTRVRARVVAQALKELINDADNVVIMGHEREDYDSIGGAIGVAVMAKADGKRVHVAVSAETTAIQKLQQLFPDNPEFQNLLVTPEKAEELTNENTLLFVVDVHRPDMVAAPKALQKTAKRVVIDHHRRSSEFIDKTLLVYLEPTSSSTCELVTELIQYYGSPIELTEIEASALYAGIVVDTKNFAVQTGSRTFDAASYLRRSGADLTLVRHLFMENFDSTKLQAQLLVNAERYGELAFTHCPKGVKNASIICARAADELITVEGVEAAFAFFYLTDGGIGVSARSQGNLNVQVIMEDVGGGGHRTVAGAQFSDADMVQVQAMVLQSAQKHVALLHEEVI